MAQAPINPAHDFATPESYEAAQAELEQLLHTLEQGQVPLDQLLQQYQRGAFLLQFCQQKLAHVQQQIAVFDRQIQTQSPEQTPSKPWKNNK